MRQECCLQRLYRAAGLPDPAPAFVVSDPPSRCSSRCRPPELSPRDHPLTRFASLQSLSSHHPPGRAGHLPWASFPLRGVNRRSPLTRASRARFVPSPAFHTPSTACSSTDLAGLFHPATTSRVRSSGCSPREKPYGLVARRCPLVVCPAPLPPVARRRQRTTPAFRAFLCSRVRGGRWWFRPPPARYPPELRPSSGSPSRAARTTFIVLSDLGLSRPSSSCRHAT
jgi:hypothetical protein